MAEKIGPGGFQSLYVEYFPSLAVLDTEEIVERIGKKWQNPGPSERHTAGDMDRILGDWVTFCNDALKGHQIAVNAQEKGIISGDLRSIEFYLIFTRGMGKQEKYPEIITSVRDAFISLLSDKVRKQISKNKPHVKVDAKLREKIDHLIKSIELQGDMHYASFERRRAAFEDD